MNKPIEDNQENVFILNFILRGSLLKTFLEKSKFSLKYFKIPEEDGLNPMVGKILQQSYLLLTVERQN